MIGILKTENQIMNQTNKEILLTHINEIAEHLGIAPIQNTEDQLYETLMILTMAILNLQDHDRSRGCQGFVFK
jgi:hypothetical protein